MRIWRSSGVQDRGKTVRSDRIKFPSRAAVNRHMMAEGWTPTGHDKWCRDYNEGATVYRCPVTKKWRVHEWRN